MKLLALLELGDYTLRLRKGECKSRKWQEKFFHVVTHILLQFKKAKFGDKYSSIYKVFYVGAKCPNVYLFNISRKANLYFKYSFKRAVSENLSKFRATLPFKSRTLVERFSQKSMNFSFR